MKAASSALFTFAAVPVSKTALVYLLQLLLTSRSPPQSAAVHNSAAKHSNVGNRAAALQSDDCPEGTCGFSALQRRALVGVGKLSDATPKPKWKIPGGLMENTYHTRLNLTELERMGRRQSYRSRVHILKSNSVCRDYVWDCPQLARRWWNCMDLDRTLPEQPARPLEAVMFLKKYCPKTCAYCGRKMFTTLTEMRKIRNDEVDKELSYARPGSPIPESLHGIFWMDQHGVHKEGTKCDPDFEFNFGFNAVNELLFTLGDGLTWEPETKCIHGEAFTGRQGHWTYYNEGNTLDEYGENRLYTLAEFPWRIRGDFCFTSDDNVEIVERFFPESWKTTQFLKLSQFTFWGDGSYSFPAWLLRFTMEKRCFGWARKSVIGPGWLKKMLGFEWIRWYPVFQIVDGHGRRTEHWDAYLKHMNTKSPEYACWLFSGVGGPPCNLGDGTQFVPVMTSKPLPPNHPGRDQLHYIKTWK